MDKLYIFSGTIKEAYKFAAATGLRPEQVQYVYDATVIEGLVNPIMIMIGTAPSRFDYAKVMSAYAKTQKKGN